MARYLLFLVLCWAITVSAQPPWWDEPISRNGRIELTDHLLDKINGTIAESPEDGTGTLPSGDTSYTPRYIYGVGASFERQKLLSISRPRPFDFLTGFAAMDGDLFYGDGEAGDGYDQLIEDATSFRDAFQSSQAWSQIDHRVDIGIVGLSGEQIVEGIEGPPYGSITKIGVLIGVLQDFCNTVYVLVPPESEGRDVGYLRRGGFTDSGWDEYQAEWDATIGARTDVTFVDAYADWADSDVPIPWEPPYLDYHPGLRSSYNTALVIWDQIKRDLPR
jgi:hypothetical protein